MTRKTGSLPFEVTLAQEVIPFQKAEEHRNLRGAGLVREAKKGLMGGSECTSTIGVQEHPSTVKG